MQEVVSRYSTGSKFFHWLIAIIVILMLSGSFFLDDLPDQTKPFAFMMHKSFGLTVLALMIMRLAWIVHKGRPSLPDTVPLWQKFMARLVQYSLYVFVILMPMVGWMMSVAANRTPVYFNLFPVPLPWVSPNKEMASFLVQCHKTIAWIIIGLLVLHVAGAFKHYFIDKDRVVQRMLPGGEM